MNKFYYILILIFFHNISYSQTRDVLILWDVTYSMTGLNGAPSIWDKTKDQIKQTIQNVPADGLSSIHILPFQNPNDNPMNLDWTSIENINQDDKQALIQYVDAFSFDWQYSRSTNICRALEISLDKIDLLMSRRNIDPEVPDEIALVLYSDGQQSSSDRLTGWNGNSLTCLDDMIERFCRDRCPVDSENRLYLLRLRNYVDLSETTCDCLVKSDLEAGVELQQKLTLRPSPVRKTIFYRDINQTLSHSFKTVLGKKPDDLSVNVYSDNPNITIDKNIEIDSNGNFLINILNADVAEGSILKARLTFIGSSSDESYNISVEPFYLEIINQRRSKAIIKGIKIQ